MEKVVAALVWFVGMVLLVAGVVMGHHAAMAFVGWHWDVLWTWGTVWTLAFGFVGVLFVYGARQKLVG